MSGGLLSTKKFSVTFDKVGELQRVCYSWELSQARASLVDREYKAIQWQKNSTAGTSDDHPTMLPRKGREHIPMES